MLRPAQRRDEHVDPRDLDPGELTDPAHHTVTDLLRGRRQGSWVSEGNLNCQPRRATGEINLDLRESRGVGTGSDTQDTPGLAPRSRYFAGRLGSDFLDYPPVQLQTSSGAPCTRGWSPLLPGLGLKTYICCGAHGSGPVRRTPGQRAEVELTVEEPADQKANGTEEQDEHEPVETSEDRDDPQGQADEQGRSGCRHHTIFLLSRATDHEMVQAGDSEGDRGQPS